MRRWLDAAWIYGDRRVASLFFFGFSSGLPLALTGATLAAWFTEAGASLTEIGLVSLVGLAYALKFLWSPLVDRLPLPLLTRFLGRRRGWLLLSQAALAVALIGLAAADPVTLRGWALFWAAVVAFASATQDIAVDAYRTEILEDEQLGAGAAVLVFGYRVAMVTSGGGALILASAFGWGWSYVCMAVLMGVGIAAVLINPEPQIWRCTTWRDGGTILPQNGLFADGGRCHQQGVWFSHDVGRCAARRCACCALRDRSCFAFCRFAASGVEPGFRLPSLGRLLSVGPGCHDWGREFYRWYGNDRFRRLLIQALQPILYGNSICSFIFDDGCGPDLLRFWCRLGRGAD